MTKNNKELKDLDDLGYRLEQAEIDLEEARKVG